MSTLTDYDKLIARTIIIILTLLLGFFAFFIYTIEGSSKDQLQSENLSLIDKNAALQSENDELKRKL